MTYEVKLLNLAESDLDEICLYLSQFYPGTPGRFIGIFIAKNSLTAKTYFSGQTVNYAKFKPGLETNVEVRGDRVFGL